jgi:2-polyprenyl-3-methyl-5-hydroxy-6-metoxy-1,4-benzoquinol methylase
MYLMKRSVSFKKLTALISRCFKRAPRNQTKPIDMTAEDDQIMLNHTDGLVPYDENLLECARTQWQFGDWESLIKIERETLQHHPDRAKLALLAAAGHLQQGDNNTARQFTRLAQDWGCSKKMISQILIAGVHNSLGRAAAIIQQPQLAIKHFESSIATGMPSADMRLFGQTRNIRETAKLGLLPQAATLMSEELISIKNSKALDASRLKIFETGLELIKGELLTQARQEEIRRLQERILHSPTTANTKQNTSLSSDDKNNWELRPNSGTEETNTNLVSSVSFDYESVYSDIFSKPPYSSDDHIQYHYVLLKIHELGFSGNFSVLDISSGRGYLINHIHKLYPKTRITSSDIKRFHQEDVSHFIKCDLSSEEDRNNLLASGTYDIITCTDVLEHLEKSFIIDVIETISKLANYAILAIANHSDIWEGYELHIIQEGNEYWEDLITQYFEIVDKQNTYNDMLMMYVLKRKVVQ